MKIAPVSNEQLLLLKAAVFPPHEALVHWRAWCADHQRSKAIAPGGNACLQLMACADYESKRLMPMIYRNLAKTADEMIPHLRDIYRHTWVKNQKHLLRMRRVVAGLQEAGIETLVIKGLALSLRYYKDLGVRLTNDLDLLIPTHFAAKALSMLRAAPYFMRVTAHELKWLPILHAIHLYDASGDDVDLHWNLLSQHPYAGADEPFWANRQSFTLPDGSVAGTISPTHQLFHNIVHGYPSHWGATHEIRWIPDSYVIYQDESAVDWAELFDLGERYRMSIPIRQGLQILINDFRLNLPAAAQRQLDNLRISQAEKTYFALAARRPSTLLNRGIGYFHRQFLAYNLFLQGKTSLSRTKYIHGEFSRWLNPVNRQHLLP